MSNAKVDGALFVGYGMPYTHTPEVSVDALRLVRVAEFCLACPGTSLYLLQ